MLWILPRYSDIVDDVYSPENLFTLVVRLLVTKLKLKVRTGDPQVITATHGQWSISW